MAKKKNPVLVGDVIKKVLDRLKRDDKDWLIKLWQKTAGPELSQHTKVKSLRKRKLTIEVENSSWLYEMSVRHKTRLLKELKSYMGEKKLKEMRFRVGKIN